MTREEEIKQAVENNIDVSIYTPKDGELLKETFYIGAKWADNNPKFPWISVKDDLPCNHKELTEGVNTKSVIICTAGATVYSNRMNYINGKWQWFGNGKVTHWMPIPEPPKKKNRG